MNSEEVLKLAKLARIGISAEEAESLSHEFEAILNYVGEVKKALVSTSDTAEDKAHHSVKNVLREDGNAHESGEFSASILNNAPSRNGDYIAVKKIL